MNIFNRQSPDLPPGVSQEMIDGPDDAEGNYCAKCRHELFECDVCSALYCIYCLDEYGKCEC